MTFRILDFIESKKLAGEHDADSIRVFVKNLVDGEIPDYQTSAWLMAVRLNGMTDNETAILTNAMASSGEMFDLSFLEGCADKHSTGGVGDKTTLIVAPMVASLGVPVVKFSGRSLDFTGGTLDKLESIPGFRTDLTTEEIKSQTEKIGVVLAGASKKMVPADKILYSLRDVTSTVDSIPLIAASIMSKKIAGGAENIVLDVKFGDGAFMREFDDAVALAEMMVSIGKKLGRKMCAVISSMESPLGRTVGNSLEVIETIETLKGNGESQLVELCLELASRMVSLSRGDDDIASIKEELENNVLNGKALEKFRELIIAQGGNDRVTEDYGLLPNAKYRYSFNAFKSGDIGKLMPRELGNLVRSLGGGRFSKTDKIDLSVGIRFHKVISDKVENEERILDVFYNDESQTGLIDDVLHSTIGITNSSVKNDPIIRKII